MYKSSFAIHAQSTRRIVDDSLSAISVCRIFSAGLLTRRPDANAFPR